MTPETAAAAIAAIHRAAFGVRPSDEWIADAVSRMPGDDPAVLDGVAKDIYDYADGLRRAARSSIPDHSQNREFPLLLRELVAAGASHRVVVDVGANGRAGSNCYDLLADFGWKGLLIEANPALLDRLHREFGAVDCTIVGCAVGVETGRMPFYVTDCDATSSLIRAFSRTSTEAATIEVEVRRLADILDEAAIPRDFDLLDLDIEGMDVAVMNDLVASSPYRPRLVLIEASFFHTTKALSDVGLSPAVDAAYEIVGSTAANLLLRRRG